MRVLLLNTYGTGGAGRACARLHQALRDSGVDARMLVLDKYDASLPECYDYHEGNRWQLRLVRRTNKMLAWRSWGKPTGFDPFSPPVSIYRLHRHPLVEWADVINLHWVAGWLDYASFFAAVNKPVAWTLHDMNPFTGGYHYKKGFPMVDYRQLIERNLAIKRAALAQTDQLHIVTLNHWMQGLVEESELFGTLPSSIIPNSLNTDLFQPGDRKALRQALGLQQDEKILLFVADNVRNERKGMQHLLAAFPRLQTQNVRVVAVGDQPPVVNGLPFLALGRINDEATIAKVYAAADVFVIPSIEDNLPNTVLESLSSGTPVTGFRIGGIPDMVRDGENGFLAADIDPVQLATVIDRAFAHDFDAQIIHQAVVARYHSSVQAQNYRSLFEKMLATHG